MFNRFTLYGKISFIISIAFISLSVYFLYVEFTSTFIKLDESSGMMLLCLGLFFLSIHSGLKVLNSSNKDK